MATAFKEKIWKGKQKRGDVEKQASVSMTGEPRWPQAFHGFQVFTFSLNIFHVNVSANRRQLKSLQTDNTTSNCCLWFNGFKFRKEKIFIEILNYNKPISLDATIRGNCLTTSTSRRLVQLLQLGLEMFGQCQTFHSFSSIIDLKWKKQKNRCSAVLLLWSRHWTKRPH